MNSRTRALINLAVVLAVGGTLLAGGVFLGTALQLRGTDYGSVTTSGPAAIGGPFTLVSANGQHVSNQTYRGKWVLIYFGYTFCPDACPTALSNISVALEKLGSDASKLQPLFVTVDPQRDTREVMSDYLKSFDPRILGLTGTEDQIDIVIREFHLYVKQEKSDGDGDSYLVSHSSYIYLMNPQGKFVNVIQGAADGDAIAVWLRKQMADAG
jgi:cytochrome oxidase Cu insertion factor (SCO1/SenC/PrrC family)